jgi:aspartyl/asparaginyl beta-hydroxylase (cupin superfamily)
MVLTSCVIPKTRSPFIDQAVHFPEYKLLYENAKVIHDEWVQYVAAHEAAKNVPRFDEIDASQKRVSKYGDWKVYGLKMMDVEVDTNTPAFPRTMAVLRQCKNIRNAFFSIFMPKTSLPGHNGPSQSVYRYLFGVSVPEPHLSYVTIEGQLSYLSEGRGFMFDDTHAHGSTNLGTLPRVALFLDIERRDISWFAKLVDAAGIGLVHIHPQFAAALKRADATWQEHEHHSGEQIFSVACSFAVF